MQAQPPDGDDAVQSLIGEVIMIGAIVALVAGMAVFFLQSDPPPQANFADLSVFATCGADGTWDSGDEQLVLVHQGGEVVEEATKVAYTVEGVETVLSEGAIGEPLASGLGIGERWSRTIDAARGDTIELQVVIVNEDGTQEVVLDREVTEWRCGSVVVTAVLDPGFAYEDADGDCLYDAAAGDVEIPDADILDGEYTASAPNGLVIPPSVGEVDDTDGDATVFNSGGGCLYIAVDLTNSNEDINALRSEGGDVFLLDATFTAGKDIIIDSGGGDITIEDLTVQSSNEGFTMDAAGGAITVTNAVIQSHKFLTIDSPGGAVDLSGASLTSDNEDISITVGSLVMPDADLDAEKNIDVSTTGDMDLQRTILEARNEQITLDKDADGNTLYIQDAQIIEPGDNDNADVRPDHNQGVVGSPSVGGLD